MASNKKQSARNSTTPDGFGWFSTTIHVAGNGGDTTPGAHTFALVGSQSYSQQWGGATIGPDATTAMPYYSGTALGPTNTISLDDNFYYSVHVLDPLMPDTTSLDLSAFKPSALPISVSRSGQTPALPSWRHQSHLHHATHYVKR